MIDYNENRKDMQIDRTADDFCQWVEELAAKYEVTADYVLDEFILD
jgi:hypothetical protein